MNSEISVFKVLPEEMVLQILVRLPIVSIFKFRTVCKFWYNLLSTNYFTELYNQILIRNPKVIIEIYDDLYNSKPDLFCVGSFDDVSAISLDFIKDKVEIRASSNGLLLCSSIAFTGVDYVCNPMTRQFKVLPEKSEELVTNLPSGDGKGARFIGFVCDLFNRKFNVVLACYSLLVEGGVPTLVSLVYDSETDKWNYFSYLQDDYFIHMNLNSTVFQDHCMLNGRLNWFSMGCHNIVFHDLKIGFLTGIKSPFLVQSEKGNRAYLLEFDGLLSVAEIADAFLTIWVLNDKHIENWEVIEKLNIRHIRKIIPHIYRIRQSGNYLVFATHRKVVMYNRSTKVWTTLFSVNNKCTLQLGFTSTFRTTLFSIDA